MSVDRAELIRRRRCRFMPLAGVFGVILAVLERESLAVLAVVGAGLTLLAVTWVRECRRAARERPPAA